MTSDNLTDPRILPCTDARKLTSCPDASPDTSIVWRDVQAQGRAMSAREGVLRGIIDRTITNAPTLGGGLARLLADNLGNADIGCDLLEKTFTQIYCTDLGIENSAARDLSAILRDDPAAQDLATSLLFFKGFHALQGWRLAHHLWHAGRRDLALYLQSRIAQIYTVDIHPAARLGCGIVLDHATAIVIGETAIVGDDVLMLHGVTLGTKEFIKGDRHPVIGNQVVIGAGASILGRTHIGDRSIVAAGSLVLQDMPPDVTIAGVPARIVKQNA